MTFQLVLVHHNTKFGNKMFGDLEDTIWTNNILTLAVTLTLNAAIHFFFHTTLWFMMMYHQTKFVFQGFNSSEYIVERVIF